MTRTNTLDVTFLHPRTDRECKAEISVDLTAQQAVDELVKAGFLDAPEQHSWYALDLVRTGRTIPLSTAITSAGVRDGDQLRVFLRYSGS